MAVGRTEQRDVRRGPVGARHHYALGQLRPNGRVGLALRFRTYDLFSETVPNGDER